MATATTPCSATKLVGKCIVPLSPLCNKCELSTPAPLLTVESRREAGGSLEITMKLRTPLVSDEVLVVEEKELEIDPWPDIITPASTKAGAINPPATRPSAEPAKGAGGGAERGTTAGVWGDVVLTEREKAEPMAVEQIDSNNVLEAEIEAATPLASSGDLAAITRKGALETKLLMLESAVRSGELDITGYCEILRDRVTRDKVLAVYLKGARRTKEAIEVMKRIRVMEEELAGVT